MATSLYHMLACRLVVYVQHSHIRAYRPARSTLIPFLACVDQAHGHIQAYELSQSTHPYQQIVVCSDVLSPDTSCHDFRCLTRMDEEDWPVRGWMILPPCQMSLPIMIYKYER